MDLNKQRNLNFDDVEAYQQAYLEENNVQLGNGTTETPTSVCLEPIVERKTVRRTRRRKPDRSPVSTGFPEPFIADDRTRSVFSRKNAHNGKPKSDEPVESDADRRFAAMSESEKRDAVAEIYERLSPEVIEFLRNRSVNEDKNGPSAENESNAKSFSPNHVAIRSTTKEPGDVEDARKSEQFLVQQGVQVESDKLEWTQSANQPVENEKILELELSKCAKELGSIGNRRFDFNGIMLSESQVQGLPSNLGLHHHGSNPEDAGYTISELILLTRSTVIRQRTFAFTTLARIVDSNGSTVVQPLVNSEALPLLFSRLGKILGGSDSLSKKAQVSLAYILLSQIELPPPAKLIPEFYFASLFYSPFPESTSNSVILSLQRTDLVSMFLQFSYSWFSQQMNESCLMALIVVRSVLADCKVQLGLQILDNVDLEPLLKIALSRQGTEITFIACEIYSSFMLFAGWDEVKDRKERSFLFDESNLTALSSHLQLYVRQSRCVEEHYQLVAASTLRVLRATLTFDSGMQVVENNLSAICATIQLCDMSSLVGYPEATIQTAKEAFYCLEAYVHSTYNLLVSKNETLTSEEQKNAVLQFGEHLDAIQPVAVHAVSIVRSGKSSRTTGLKAAAAHFAGSFYTVYKSSISSSSAGIILGSALEASSDLSNLELEPMLALNTVSLLHGISRMLINCTLPPASVKDLGNTVLKLIANATKSEFNACYANSRNVFANCCSEWMVRLARMKVTSTVLLQALDLLPLVTEPQVAVRVLSQCILNREFLVSLRPDTDEVLNEQDIEELSEHALRFFIDERNASLLQGAEGVSEMHRPRTGIFCRLSKHWFLGKKTFSVSALVVSILVEANLVDASSIYRLLPFLDHDHMGDINVTRMIISIGTRTFREQKFGLHGFVDTRLSSYSSDKRSPITERLILLAEKLVERGPWMEDRVDALATLVLNVMMLSDADPSLRLHLWRFCVRECGGAALFARAILFVDSVSTSHDLEEDEIMVEYTTSLTNGSLQPSRCPPVIQGIIFSKLRNMVLNGNARGVLSPVLSDGTSMDAAIRCLHKWQPDILNYQEKVSDTERILRLLAWKD